MTARTPTFVAGTTGVTNATCVFCHRKLPRNEAIEAFPFGRRVAYDPVRSRYWVVCQRCGKWTIAPLEADERDATIEHLERWWRGSTARYSTDGIGLGQYSPRLSVVRVGEAGWSEFAAWRYGATLRRRRALRYAGLGATVALTGAFVGTGFLALGPGISLIVGFAAYERFVPTPWLRNSKGVCRLSSGAGARSLLRNKDLMHLELEQTGRGWSLNAVHNAGTSTLTGPEGVRALAYALPRINFYGATQTGVTEAVSRIVEAGGPGAMVERAAEPIRSARRGAKDPGLIVSYPSRIRLALEMATHEHTEHRALEGELSLLRSEWREAEEIAAIASRLPFA